MTQLATTPGATPQSNRMGAFFRAIPPIYLVLLLLLVGIAFYNPMFREPAGILNLLRRAAPLMVLTAGQLYVIVSGGFDLSVGSTMTLTVLASAMLINNDPSNTWWVILLMLGMGVVIGLINGSLVAYARVPSLIATLGMLLSLRGLALYITGGAPRGYLTDNYRAFGRAGFEDVPLVGRFPYAVIVLVVVVGLLAYLFSRTNLGRQLLAVGDNQRAARLAGIPVPRMRLVAFVVSSLTAVVAGILLGGFAGVTLDVGDGFELQAISAAVLGGAVLLGGRGAVMPAVAGALALEALFTLLNLWGLPKPLRDAVQGLIIIGAVAYGAYRSRKIR